MWPSWSPVLTLARRRLLAVLSCQVLHIIQGNGPQSWLATQSGFKNNLMGKGKLMSICRDRREGREDSCPGNSPGTPQSWTLRSGLVSTGAASALPASTQLAGLGHCSEALSTRPYLRAGTRAGQLRVLEDTFVPNLSPSSPTPRTQPLTEMLRKAHVVPEVEAGGCGCWQWLTAQPGCLASRT